MQANLERFPANLVKRYREEAAKLGEKDFPVDEDGRYVPGQIKPPVEPEQERLKDVVFTAGKVMTHNGGKLNAGDVIEDAASWPNLGRHLEMGRIMSSRPLSRTELAFRPLPAALVWECWEGVLMERLRDVSPDFDDGAEVAPVNDEAAPEPGAVVATDEDGNEVVLTQPEIISELKVATTAKRIKECLAALNVPFPSTASKADIEALRDEFVKAQDGSGDVHLNPEVGDFDEPKFE